MGQVTETIILAARNATKQAFNEVEGDARKAGGAVKASFDWVGAAAIASGARRAAGQGSGLARPDRDLAGLSAPVAPLPG